jgi:TPP-dependent indolepyruvate ferredoxin oxidoreductase alpha subunit
VPNFSVWSRRARSMCAPENYKYVAVAVVVAVAVAVDNKQQQHQTKYPATKNTDRNTDGEGECLSFFICLLRVGSGKPKWRFGSASCVGCVGCMYCTEVCMSLTGRRTTKSNR